MSTNVQNSKDNFELIYHNEQPDLMKSFGLGAFFVLASALIENPLTLLILPFSIRVK
jgi:hypothetical protein